MVVAQDKGSMCVWYNIEAVDAITNVPIKVLCACALSPIFVSLFLFLDKQFFCR